MVTSPVADETIEAAKGNVKEAIAEASVVKPLSQPKKKNMGLVVNDSNQLNVPSSPTYVVFP